MRSKIGTWSAIVGAGLVASITTAAAFFPDLKVILAGMAALVSAVVSYVVAKEKKE